MKANIISKLEELLANADISAVANKVKDLQREYEQSFSKEMEKAKQEFVDDGGKAKDFVYSKTAEDTKIIQLFEQYRKLKKQDEEKLAAEQNKNLEVKLRIIKDINDLSQLEVNVGSAIKKLQELQLSWKETGAVSPHKYKELQSEYSKAVESFNYNINIFRQLQDHDFKKNTELKLEIIQKINSLIEKDNVKEVEQLIKIYRNDWEEIGPVLQDNWTELKLTYKDAIDKVYAKIKSYYNEMEDRKKQNLDGKKSIVEKAKAFLNELPESDDKWKAKTEQLIKLQEEYKNIGYTEKPAGDIVYREFRNVCDEFFNKKKVYLQPNPNADFEVSAYELNSYDPRVEIKNKSERALRYMWSFGDGGVPSTEVNPTYTYEGKPGEYNIRLMAIANGQNCTDVAVRKVVIPEELIYYVPNTFTPNGDANNNTFQPVFTSGYDPQDYTFMVFNRWGDLVFESHNANIGWDGTYIGTFVGNDTYTWKLEFKEKKTQKRHSKIGVANLIR